MRPHPIFAEWNIPSKHNLGNFVLNALNVSENERDYAAIMESTANIRTAAPHLTWPKGLTIEKNFIDLAWHQKEFETRRSFAWIIEDREREYLGCVYVYPSIQGEQSADVAWWWRAGAYCFHEEFQNLLFDWFAGPEWPALDYRKIVN